MEQFREIVHHYKDKTDLWFGKYMKYKRHKENRISYLLLRHFPFSSFTAYNLAKDKIVFL